ncbi:MAG: hypothetical protein WBA10_11805 [Elainellaceae cyanobacterium]
MAKKKRLFSGMGYRDVQHSNSTRRRLLSKANQSWLKRSNYRNVGWENVIRLYQKINDLIEDSDDDLTLEELFLEADRIGEKYQSPEEIRDFNRQLSNEVSEISGLVDKQFPEDKVEFIDFSKRN